MKEELKHNASEKWVCKFSQRLIYRIAAVHRKLPYLLIVVLITVVFHAVKPASATPTLTLLSLISPTEKDLNFQNIRKSIAENGTAITAEYLKGTGQQRAKLTINACPRECSCLDSYFSCRRSFFRRVPQLPSYIQTLDLALNKLNESVSEDIRNLPELSKLSLKQNALESIPKFTGLTALKHLNLASNNIKQISSEALASLPQLRFLDLTKNRLRVITWRSFPIQNKLESLFLNQNEIMTIEESALDNLVELTDLKLDNNRLSTLPTGVFKALNKLKKLFINFNKLEINWSIFKGLYSLQTLSLKSNNIRVLQEGVFHVLRSIESIDLDDNGITGLNRSNWFNLTKLRHLSVANNSISRIELDTWEFTQSIVSLDLSHNKINEFKSQHLDCLHKLKFLDLGHNKIHYLNENTFDCVKNLEELILRRNRLTWVIEDPSSAPSFKSLRRLKRLDLCGNNLKQINTKSLAGLQSLEVLNLGKNTLSSIQAGAFDNIIHLHKIILSSRNLICDCDLTWFWKFSKVQQVKINGSAVCGYPENLRDRELTSIVATELQCAETPKPVFIQEPTNQLAVKGANLTMECEAESLIVPNAVDANLLKVTWRHDNQNVRKKLSPSSSHSSHTIATIDSQLYSDGTKNMTMIKSKLHLYDISYESTGKYQCIVSNAFGNTYSQKFKMTIGIHPRFLKIPSNLTIEAGDTARLVCSATGDPIPEIALQKYGATDFPAATERRLQVIREENAFLIINAKAIDTGIYTCTAESVAGEAKVNATLIVNDAPDGSNIVEQNEINLGETSVIECLGGHNFIQTQRDWFKDNKPIHSSTSSTFDRSYFTAKKELLVIVNAQSSDAGLYKCEIHNGTKTISMFTELIVVKADFNKHVIIIGVLLVTIACIFIGSLIVWLILYCQKRKHHAHVCNNQNCGRSGYNDNDANEFSGDRINQTQLTTLSSANRSLINFHNHLHNCNEQNIETLTVLEEDQGKCLIVTPSQNYYRMQQSCNGREEVPLEYLARGCDDVLSALDMDQNQDYLSSKDSGTGSDAAVKRSIDDFTISLMPSDEMRSMKLGEGLLQTEGRIPSTAFACPDTDDDDDADFEESAIIGATEFEIENSKKDSDSIQKEMDDTTPSSGFEKYTRPESRSSRSSKCMVLLEKNIP